MDKNAIKKKIQVMNLLLKLKGDSRFRSLGETTIIMSGEGYRLEFCGVSKVVYVPEFEARVYIYYFEEFCTPEEALEFGPDALRDIIIYNLEAFK